MPEQQLVTQVDAEALANAFVKRMTWPSMHWRTQSLDWDAAYALALVALDGAPEIIATARLKERAMLDVLGPKAGDIDKAARR